MATKFRYPTGTRPLLIEETARRRRIETRLVDLLDRAGFGEIILPIIDFTEPYAGVMERVPAKRSYRFTDREGELVSIRSDFTPMVARALAPLVHSAKAHIRVFYRGDVIRCEDSRLGTDRELFQIGAEIVGDGSPAADVEVLRLVASIVESFGIQPLIVYTDGSIVDAFEPEVRAALHTKQHRPALPPPASKLISGAARIEDVRDLSPTAADRLEAIDRQLAGDRRFVLQLDDVEPTAGYYTGLRFRVFGSDLRRSIAQGGRYDALYAHFGAAAPAVGFTLTVDELERN